MKRILNVPTSLLLSHSPVGPGSFGMREWWHGSCLGDYPLAAQLLEQELAVDEEDRIERSIMLPAGANLLVGNDATCHFRSTHISSTVRYPLLTCHNGEWIMAYHPDLMEGVLALGNCDFRELKDCLYVTHRVITSGIRLIHLGTSSSGIVRIGNDMYFFTMRNPWQLVDFDLFEAMNGILDVVACPQPDPEEKELRAKSDPVGTSLLAKSTPPAAAAAEEAVESAALG